MIADKFIIAENKDKGSPYFTEHFMLVNGGKRKKDTITFKDNSSISLDANCNYKKL
jgi:hypothetical protein